MRRDGDEDRARTQHGIATWRRGPVSDQKADRLCVLGLNSGDQVQNPGLGFRKTSGAYK
jgi:hypothetical protein